MIKGLRSSLGICSAFALTWLTILGIVEPNIGSGIAMLFFLLLTASEYPLEEKHEQSSGGNGRGKLPV